MPCAAAVVDMARVDVKTERKSSDMARSGDMLVVKDLVVSYGGQPIVWGTSLTIGSGEFVTLLGPSGSGKTSILRAVAGYVHPDSGEIWIGDRSMVGQSPRVRNCGMVFQSYALFPHMTVAANVAYGLKARGIGRRDVAQRVQEMLDAMHLEGFGNRYPHELSGGQQQRVALARALVVRPDLLLMDEPLAALDLRLREQLQVEIRRVQQQFKISTLYVTHDQGEAFTMSDRIMVINNGRVVSNDQPRRVYMRPSCSFTARFVGNSSLMEIPVSEARSGYVKLPGQSKPFRLNWEVSADVGHLFVVLRPETVQCRDSVVSGWTEGRVVARRFAGINLMVAIKVGDHEILAVDPTGEMQLEQPVWFTWNLEDAHVIQETEQGLPVDAPEQSLIPIASRDEVHP